MLFTSITRGNRPIGSVPFSSVDLLSMTEAADYHKKAIAGVSVVESGVAGEKLIHWMLNGLQCVEANAWRIVE